MILQISAGQGPRECELAVTKLFAALEKEFGGLTVLSRGMGSGQDTCSSIIFCSGEDLGFLEGSVQWICESPYRKGHKRKNWFVDVSVIAEAGNAGREMAGGNAGTVGRGARGGEAGAASREMAGGRAGAACRGAAGGRAGTVGGGARGGEAGAAGRERAGGRAGAACRGAAGGKAGAVCREGELRFERFHCGGKGGQNVNKVETGVRLVHLPTGLTVTSTEERSQFMNRQKALKKLEKILGQMEEDSKRQQKKAAWMEHSRLERGNPVRVYEGMNFRRKM